MDEENKVESGFRDHRRSFMDRLHEASNEIDSIKSSFSKGMEDLARIQSMISAEGVDNISTMIQDFENKLTESERKKEEAIEGARRYSEELEKEKERLVKLWDAYKNQEEELASQEKRANELDARLKEVEQSKMQMDQDVNARINTLSQKLEEKEQEVQNLNEFKQRIKDFDGIRNELEETIHGLRGEINGKDETIKELQSQLTELEQFKDMEDFKVKFEEVSDEFEKEKDRLTKLFKLYEETESENKKLKEEVTNWQNWFDSNQDIFNRLFSSVDNLKKNVTSTSEENTQEKSDMDENSEEESKPKRRRLRLKK